MADEKSGTAADVERLAENAQWNRKHGDPDAAKRQQAVVNLVRRDRK